MPVTINHTDKEHTFGAGKYVVLFGTAYIIVKHEGGYYFCNLETGSLGARYASIDDMMDRCNPSVQLLRGSITLTQE